MLPTLLLVLLAAVPPLSPLRVVHRFEAVGRYAAGDRGVDLAGVPGQTVVSATAGTVRFAGRVAGAGVVSVALGDGRRVTYEPLMPLVHAGDRLAAGATLGRLTAGRAGCPAPACLHWGLVSGRGATLVYTDPMTLLGRSAVRLLPLSGARGGASRALPAGAGPPATSPRAVPVATAPTTPLPSTATAAGSRSAAATAVTAGIGAAGLVAGAVGAARRRGRASRRAPGR